MSDTTLTPYLSFKDSKTKEAMEFYRGIFGGELKMQTFGDTPMDFPEEKKALIMHASLEGGAMNLFASDGAKDEDYVAGTNVNLSINGSDEQKLREYFDDLSEGGTVTMPLEKAFWGDLFGMVTDKYGIHWMVNVGSGEMGSA
ncbi:MAG: VOC family protein [Patescibacteria group bacterium]